LNLVPPFAALLVAHSHSILQLHTLLKLTAHNSFATGSSHMQVLLHILHMHLFQLQHQVVLSGLVSAMSGLVSTWHDECSCPLTWKMATMELMDHGMWLADCFWLLCSADTIVVQKWCAYAVPTSCASICFAYHRFKQLLLSQHQCLAPWAQCYI